MTQEEKILSALKQINEVELICKELEYRDYLTSRCSTIKHELMRQFSVLKSHPDDLVFDR
jgi:hypothetical protein